MKKLFTLIILPGILTGSLFSCNAQPPSSAGKEEIHWLTFEQAIAENGKTPKKIFIDISTDWCGWCKRMDATTFKDSTIVQFMNDNYYAVRLNAETKDSIHFMNRIFTYKPDYKANELALSLLSGKMSYPTFVFMDEGYALLSPLPGYQTTEQLMPVLRYFSDNIYKNTKWEDYQKTIQN